MALKSSFMRGLAVLAALAAVLITGTDPVPAVADEVPAATAAITTGAVFNDPQGTATQQNAIVDHIENLVRQAPAEARLRLAVYVITDMGFVDELIAASARGVHVRIVLDASEDNDASYAKLRTALGTDRSANSYVKRCVHRACIGNAGTPRMHNKFYLFSRTGGADDVVVQSSANLTPHNTVDYWNNAVTVVGNTPLYTAYVDYFADLAASPDRETDDYYRMTTSGDVKLYFFPRAGTDDSTDTIVEILDNVTCEGNTSVGTPTGRTQIRIGAWDLTRTGIANKLRQLADRNCWVDVVYRHLGTGVADTLSGHDRIKLYELNQDDGDLIHSKYMLIEGTYAGQKDTKWVFTGSPNYDVSSLRENDEALLRFKSDSIHDQYKSNFVSMRTVVRGY
ncbi:phospholipase D-like domain-containing protein [Streptomyces sp. NPDC020996]|uniref:phospholipase D-like domain-containing protein n=1 Tax=Streptomyces sp. NPDC020996 TaxID=3154791 RepID=UPI0033DE1EBB